MPMEAECAKAAAECGLPQRHKGRTGARRVSLLTHLPSKVDAACALLPGPLPVRCEVCESRCAVRVLLRHAERRLVRWQRP